MKLLIFYSLLLFGCAFGALQTIHAEKGKYDRILVIGDLHGDLYNTLNLFRGMGIVSLQKDYVKNILVHNAQKKIKKYYKKKLRNGDEDEEEHSGLYPEDDELDTRVIIDRGGRLMGSTSEDLFHWCANASLVVILGDAMNVGPDDLAILTFIRRLSIEARYAGGKMIFTLGNHEIMNIFGDYSGVHPWSFERSGGVEGRTQILSYQTNIGRFLHNSPAAFYYDGLVFVHGGVYPQAVEVVQNEIGRTKITGKEFVKNINKNVRKAIGRNNINKEEAKKAIASLALNVDYKENGDHGILLVHPLKKCKKIRKANRLLGIQSQVVGHTPHDLPDYNFCNSSLYAIDFKISAWKGGKYTSLAYIELNRVHLGKSEQLQIKNSDSSAVVYNYKWDSKLVVVKPPEDEIAKVESIGKQSYLKSILLVLLGVVLVESLIWTMRLRYWNSKSNSYSPV